MGLEALHKGGTYKLQRIPFVPAQYPDTLPIPEGVEIIGSGQGPEVRSTSRRLPSPCLL